MAREACKSEGGRLVEVEEEEKQEAIEKMVREIFGDNWEDKWFWIGLRRDDPDGEFLWEESQKQLNFTNWGPNEPGRKKLCAGIASTKVEDNEFAWVGKRCDRFFSNSLCEK